MSSTFLSGHCNNYRNYDFGLIEKMKLKSFAEISKTTVYKSGDHLFLPHQYFIFMIRITRVIVQTSQFIKPSGSTLFCISSNMDHSKINKAALNVNM